MALIRKFQLWNQLTGYIASISQSGSLRVAQDEEQLDAFRRLKVSNMRALRDLINTYPLVHEDGETGLTGNGTVVHLPNESSLRLSTGGTASGDEAVFYSHEPFRYQPGSALYIMMTITNDNLGIANSDRQWGYFNGANGLFFELNGTALRLGRRTSTSGTKVDNYIDQANWNGDKVDGTGLSGVTLDVTKDNIYMIELQWLGAGIARFSLIKTDGTIIRLHTMESANQFVTPYMTTAILPVQFRCTNTGTTGSASSMKFTCFQVASEGGGEPFETSHGVALPAGVAVGIGTFIPLISLRPKLTVGGVDNRTYTLPRLLSVFGLNASVQIRMLNDAVLTAPSWTSAGTESGIEYDISATAVSGGSILAQSYVRKDRDGSFPLTGMYRHNGMKIVKTPLGHQDILTIVAKGVGGTSTVETALNWSEIR